MRSALGARAARARRLAAWAALSVAAFLLTARADFSWDEAWFLQVVDRVLAGDVLYRDVFFGATPLSVFLAAPFHVLLGVEVLVLKGLVTACFVATAALTVRAGRLLGLHPAWLVALVVVLLLYAPPRAVSLYTPLATTLALACLVLALERLDRPGETRLAAAAGAAAGLAFATKQNVGALALAALLVAVAAGGVWRRPALAALAAFAAIAVLLVLSLWALGSLGGLADYGFLGKGAYVKGGSVGPLEGLRGELMPAGGEDAFDIARRAYWQGAYLLAVVAPVALALAAGRVRGALERRRLSVLAAFLVAGLIAPFPRYEGQHVGMIVPFALLALVAALHVLVSPWPTRRTRIALIALFAWAALGLAVLTVRPLVWLATGSHGLSELPHFRGMLIERDLERRLAADARALSAAAHGDDVLLLSARAGFLYLVSGVGNPTPYDYPLRTAFGRSGEEAVRRAVADGRIRLVCIGFSVQEALRPVELERYVTTRLRRVADLGSCTLYGASS